MAFPIPTHLPKKQDSRDVSTQVLTKIAETPYKSLKGDLAASWVSELDETIRTTKLRIHERIHSDLPSFEKQLATSISVQQRLSSLSSNVDALERDIANPESGLVPTLLGCLRNHAALAQEVSEARTRQNVLCYLLECRNQLRHLVNLVEKANLVEATTTCTSLCQMMAGAPTPLQSSEVMADMKRRCAVLQNYTEEQLQNAYSRSIIVSESEVSVRSSVTATPPRSANVPDPVSGERVEPIIHLSEIFASLSPPALSMHLSTLRRDITSRCVEYVLKQPTQVDQVTISDMVGTSEHKLTFQREPPGSRDLTLCLTNLTTIMTFFSNALFPHLPPPDRKPFLLSLCAPIRTAILNLLLLPSLPSTVTDLPAFLNLAKQAVHVEDEIIIKMLGDSGAERGVESWVDHVGMHYERRRRAELLNKARLIAVSPHDDTTAFRVEVPLVVDDKVIPIQVDDGPALVNGSGQEAAVEADAWGFEEEAPKKTEESPTDDWGFDDDLDAEPEPEPTGSASQESQLTLEPPKVEDKPREEDPGDAWGWNDDAEPEAAEDESAWDDAWDEKPAAPPPVTVPKQAKGLEKRLGSKSIPNSPVVTQAPAVPPPVHSPPHPIAQSRQQHEPRPPIALKPVQVTESYVVSGRTKELLQLVEDILREGAKLASSGVLDATTTGAPGSTIVQTAAMALELFRALVPVTNGVALKQSAKEPMRFSNDCLYVGRELRRVVAGLGAPKAAARSKLEEGLERLQVLAESWFEDTIAREERLVEETLDNAKGFIDTNQQDQFDECESAVNDVLQRIRRIAPQWKAVLTKSRYYEALGSVVDTALSRILADVLALEDITEAESHRLCELCHIMNSLEGLFVEDPDEPSFVVSYVPSWLKFSYLSELLEASIADISYLFGEGALVDFEIEELVKLVRALFADTPLRAHTVHKLQQGHPISNS